MKWVGLGLIAVVTFAAAAALVIRSRQDASTAVSSSAKIAASATVPKDETDLAKSLLLTVDDFPAGWAEEPQTEGATPFDKCGEAEDQGQTGTADTGWFSRGSGLQVSAGATVYTSDVFATQALERTSQEAQCMLDVINRGGADTSELEFSDASFGPLSFPDSGDESHAFRLRVHAKAKGRTGFSSEGNFYLDVIFIRVGRFGLSLLASDATSPPDPHDWEQFVNIAASRARQAQ